MKTKEKCSNVSAEITQPAQITYPVGPSIVNKVGLGARYASYEVYTYSLNAVADAVHNIAESPENTEFRLNSVAMTHITNESFPYRAVVVLERMAAEPVKAYRNQKQDTNNDD